MPSRRAGWRCAACSCPSKPSTHYAHVCALHPSAVSQDEVGSVYGFVNMLWNVVSGHRRPLYRTQSPPVSYIALEVACINILPALMISIMASRCLNSSYTEPTVRCLSIISSRCTAVDICEGLASVSSPRIPYSRCVHLPPPIMHLSIPCASSYDACPGSASTLSNMRIFKRVMSFLS